MSASDIPLTLSIVHVSSHRSCASLSMFSIVTAANRQLPCQNGDHHLQICGMWGKTGVVSVGFHMPQLTCRSSQACAIFPAFETK
ncbi:hypothetical protein BR93DRAFT_798210 [Coniochaeta sp. PMI_546]|nr:hypothetical protein BR93DRAFT_798210 [Coniochaeta sp. PMI_546]